MTYLCYICIFTIICCIVTTGSATTLYTENTVNEENNNSAVGQTSVGNSNFSKFYVRNKLLSLNLVNLDSDESSANDEISRSKGSNPHGLSHEDTVKEFNDNIDLSVSSLARSCGTERKLQDKKTYGKVVKHSVKIPIVEAYYPKSNVEADEGSAKLSSAYVSSDSPKDATTDEAFNANNSVTTKLDNNIEKKEAAEEDKKESAEDDKKESAEDDKIEVAEDDKKEAVEEDKKESVEEDKKEAAEEDKKESVEDDKKEAAEEDKKEATEEDDKKESAEEDDKKESAEEDDKKESAEEDDKKESADDDKIEVAEDDKKEAAEDDKKEAAEEEDKKEAAEEEDKKEATEEDKKEAVEEDKKEAAEDEDKKEAAEEDERKDSRVTEQNIDSSSSLKRRRIYKGKSSQINQVPASPTTEDMNKSTKELNTSKDGLYADNLKLENINNIALINTSSPQSTEVGPSSTALPVVPDAVLLSNKDKEQHRQIEAIVSGGKSAPESTTKVDTNPTKSAEMPSPTMNLDHSHQLHSHQPHSPGQHPRLSYDRLYHLRSNEGYRNRLHLNAKIVRKNIVEVHISSQQDVSCYIIGRSGQRSPKTTIYSTQGRTRRIHLSSQFTPFQVECGDNDVYGWHRVSLQNRDSSIKTKVLAVLFYAVLFFLSFLIYYLLTQPVVEDGEIEEENTLLDQSSHSYSEPHQLDGEEYKQDLISKKVGNGRKGRKSRDYFHLNPNVSCPHCGYQNNRNAVVCLKCNNMLGQ